MSSKWRRGGIPGRKRRTQIEGQWVAYTREMIESPAYRALSLQGRKILRRLEIEHCAHGGAENGRLPCTYDDFVAYGCWRNGITAALIEVQALGFTQVMSIGRRAYADVPGQASTYRLTYLPAHDGPATDKWKNIESDQAARAAVKAAMANRETYLETDMQSPRRRYRARNEGQKARNKSTKLGIYTEVQPRRRG
jgi:hypothetical protein